MSDEQASRAKEIDRARTERLAMELFRTVRPSLATGPYRRDNVFVVLNAVAWVAATVVAGAGDEAALEFFIRALQDNLKEMTPEAS